MTGPNDLIPYPGSTSQYARRALVNALVSAGTPPANSMTRLYAEQKDFWDAYQAGTGAGADNPDDERQALAHVRGVAADINPTPERVRALTAAGLVRPHAHEPWHWQLAGDVRRFPLVRTRPDLTPTPSKGKPMIVNIVGKAKVRHRQAWLLEGGVATPLDVPLADFATIGDERAVQALAKRYKGLPV